MSTGFSPFELLYDRVVRRLLDLLRDYWENPQLGQIIVAYVVKREKLVEMAAFAQDNTRSAQDHQTIWYDKKAVFNLGQKTLLFYLTSDNLTEKLQL